MSSTIRRLYHNEIQYDFVGHRRRWYAISGVIILISLLSLLIRGFNLGIDFKGGAEFRFPATGITVDEARNTVSATGVNPESVQAASAAAPQILVKTAPLSEQQINRVTTAIQTNLHIPANQINTSTVGATWGASITKKALEGLGVFLLAVIVYLSVRYEPKMALAAIIALLHDLIVTAGVYSLVGFEVTPATVIALLTILGFSLYDTVVVFDKVRENTAGLIAAGRRTYTQASNDAVNQTLMRSINTSLIALLPVAALLFIGAGLLGAGTLKDLALAQLVGLASGAYSSIFIATPLLVDLKEREPGMRALAAKVQRSQAAAASRERGGVDVAAVGGAATQRSGDVSLAKSGGTATALLDRDGESADEPGGQGAGGVARPAKRQQPRRPAKRGRPSGKRKR